MGVFHVSKPADPFISNLPVVVVWYCLDRPDDFLL